MPINTRKIGINSVKLVKFAFNAGKHADTGFSQLYLLYGFEPNQSIDLAVIPMVSDYDALAVMGEKKIIR